MDVSQIWKAPFKLRNRLKYAAALVLLWAAFFAVPVRAESAAAAETEGGGRIAMKADYGYGGIAKSGRYVPVRVSLDNAQDRPFTGKLQVLSMESDFRIYRYGRPVAVEAYSQAQVALNIPLGYRADQLFVVLLDEGGNELVRQRLKMNVGQDTSQLMIGILCDTPGQLQYLDGIGINYGMLKTKTSVLSADTFPTDETGLDLMDVILITNYDTSRLSEDQMAAITEWVKKGGALVFGTGERAQQALGPFAEGLIDLPYGVPAMISVDMGVEYATSGPGDSYIDLSCVDLSLKGGDVLLSSDELPVLTAVSLEKGRIAAAAYDFVDIAQFCQVQHSYVEKILTNLLGEEKIDELSDSVYGADSGQYWSVQSVINTGDVDRLPSLGLYAAIMLIYIALSGPVIYLFLKRRKLRRFYRPGVVILSLCFTSLIYVIGSRTRFRDTFFTYATIRDVTEDSVLESTVLNMRTPYNKSYSVALDPEYTVRPVTQSYKDSMPAPNFTGEEEYEVSIDEEADEIRISVNDAHAFDPLYFQLEKKYENEEGGSLTGEITMFGGRIYGKVTNGFDYPVDKAAILMYGQIVLLDRLEPGETKSLDGLEVINCPLTHTSAVAERITGGYRYRKADLKDAEYLESLRQTRLLTYYLNNYFTGYMPDARIVGFRAEKEKGTFLKTDGFYESRGSTMLTSAISVNTMKDGKVYRSGLARRPRVVSGNYNARFNTMFGTDPLILEYSLGSRLQVDQVTFNQISEYFTENEKYNYILPFSGSVYLYNYDSGSYDLMDHDKTAYNYRELTSYLSPSNTLTVKYVPDSSTEYNWEMTLPMPAVTGRRA